MRRGQSPLNAAFRNPTVIGALAVLITILAVFLAYNANNGLPFVQSYRLTAQVPNAAALVPGNEVRIGGVRVGIIETISPVAQQDGTYTAELALKLDKTVDPLPEDSTVIIRSRSALGLKYLQIVRGTSDEGFAAGSVMPLAAATPEPSAPLPAGDSSGGSTTTPDAGDQSGDATTADASGKGTKDLLNFLMGSGG